MAKTPRQPPLSMAQQAAGLVRLFPFGTVRHDRHRLSWTGVVAPSEFSRDYTLELIYERRKSPEIWVRNPNLRELAGGRKLPHVYDQQAQKLCLYVPGVGFWTPCKSIASTVMLWACLWLYYFELWLVTDIWHGRGIHPVQECASPVDDTLDVRP
jgi:hypothetical protein